MRELKEENRKKPKTSAISCSMLWYSIFYASTIIQNDGSATGDKIRWSDSTRKNKSKKKNKIFFDTLLLRKSILKFYLSILYLNKAWHIKSRCNVYFYLYLRLTKN